jgi:hypothetical protein
MRIAAILAVMAVASIAVGCSGNSKAKPTSTSTAAASAVATTPTAVLSAGVTVVATAEPSTAANAPFPGRCSALVVNAGVDALAVQHLQLVADSVAGTSGSVSQLVCRFQGNGTGSDTAIIIVAAGYADASAAHDDDALARQAAEGQGGSFTPRSGIGDEAYSFQYPAVSGVAARKGRFSVSIGVGKLLGAPAPGEFDPLLQSLFTKLGG